MSTQHHQQLARSAGIFTGATMLSRILGYARDSMVANYFGAGIAADAFYAAFRIANLFRRLLGEGALSASFVPVFSEYSEKHGPQKTQEFLNILFSVLVVILVVMTVLGIVFAPQITSLIAMGFEKTPERFELTVTLTRCMFPFLLFVSLAALITGVLNSLRVFFLPALAPACLSVAEIVYLLAIAPHLSIDKQVIGLAASVSVGGLAQFFIHLPALREKGYGLKWAWNVSHEGLRRVGKLMVPATVGISVDQINAFVDTICASFLVTGSVTALYYSNRVMQLPLALFGVALSQVSLPAMSTSAAKGDIDAVKSTLNFALRLTIFMILPATAGLLVLGRPVVQLLFEHGQFDAWATTQTTHALFFFVTGLFAFACVKILASAFYAFQNTRVPVTIAAICVCLNIVLNLLLMKPMGVGGLALATSIASWVNALALFWMLRKQIGHFGGKTILKTSAQSLLACIGMGFLCWAIMHSNAAWPMPLKLGLSISGGALFYLGSTRLLGMSECDSIWLQLARRSR